jgi:hypothetical protein
MVLHGSSQAWTWVATGPSAGIQLPSGRLVVCADHVRGTNASTGAGFRFTLTAHSLHAHYTLTAHSLHTHCTLTTHSLHTHFIHYAHCTLTAHSLHTHCTLTSPSLHTHCTLTAHPLHASLHYRCGVSLDVVRRLWDYVGCLRTPCLPVETSAR